MDTDVELLQPLDDILKYEAISGFESETRIPTGLMACKKGHDLFVEFLNDYKGCTFVRKDGSLDITTNVTRITNICLNYGLELNNTKQVIKGFTLLPNDYLCPKNVETGEMNITKNTICIHHFDGSWHSEEDLFIAKYAEKIKGIPMGSYFLKFFAILKFRGLKYAMKESIGWIRR